MTLSHNGKTKTTGHVCWLGDVIPDIYTRKELEKIKGKCCDYPDWNDALIDALGNPYIKCENCGAMCFD